jgi:hypothetical protein
VKVQKENSENRIAQQSAIGHSPGLTFFLSSYFAFVLILFSYTLSLSLHIIIHQSPISREWDFDAGPNLRIQSKGGNFLNLKANENSHN